RVGFAMQLNPGSKEEYKKRHDEIWPELSRELKAAGVYDYSIYLDIRTNTLYASQKLQDDNRSGELPFRDIVKKWWEYMADIMETNADNSPVVYPLEEMFYFA
ncbi:MAG: L-rhamnose mutarotase, partial [Spirochaetia bacterium]|nr:L-rhamnose mutarotase [Spirochaetia bacterium]